MALQSEYGGLYRGVVHDIRDPLAQNRIKVRVPQLFGQEVTEWAWPVQFSTAELQSPEVGQGVWVAFESGDPSFPVWLGTFYTKTISSKKVLINNPSASQLTEEFIISTNENLNLVSTLVAMSQELEALQGQIDGLDARVTALESQIP
jgi:hypothetical protein